MQFSGRKWSKQEPYSFLLREIEKKVRKYKTYKVQAIIGQARCVKMVVVQVLSPLAEVRYTLLCAIRVIVVSLSVLFKTSSSLP